MSFELIFNLKLVAIGQENMDGLVRAIQLSFVVIGFVALAIVLPAVVFGVVHHWQVKFLMLSYLVFYVATIWRVAKYGQLRKPSEDEQFKRNYGIWILAGMFLGILAVHWLAVYDFARFQQSANAEVNLAVTNLGIGLIISAIAIAQVAILTLRKLFNRIAIEPDHKLITTGIYGIIRHPIYLSYVLLFAGFCMLLHSNLITFVILGSICTIWLGHRIAIEEEMLLAKFGEEYKAYQRKTKKLFPFIY